MELATERLVLRELEAADAEVIFAYQSVPAYSQFYHPVTYGTHEDVAQFIEQAVAQRHALPRTHYELAMELRSERRVIGTCGVHMGKAYSAEAEFRCELAPGYWGQGYATEAARALVAFAFRKLSVDRVWTECVAENSAAVHFLEGVGMRQEQRLQNQKWMQERWWDTLIFGVNYRDWPSAKCVSGVRVDCVAAG